VVRRDPQAARARAHPAHAGLAVVDHRGPPALLRRPAGPDGPGVADVHRGGDRRALRGGGGLAMGGKVIECQSPLNVLKYTYDHSCY
jgi:hypothetical protein